VAAHRFQFRCLLQQFRIVKPQIDRDFQTLNGSIQFSGSGKTSTKIKVRLWIVRGQVADLSGCLNRQSLIALLQLLHHDVPMESYLAKDLWSLEDPRILCLWDNNRHDGKGRQTRQCDEGRHDASSPGVPWHGDQAKMSRRRRHRGHGGERVAGFVCADALHDFGGAVPAFRTAEAIQRV
jgi:hypothetical protein